MNEPQVICEEVTVTGDGYDDTQLIQYYATETADKDSCLRYLRDCGFVVTTKPHPVVGPCDDPAISWGDLSDLVAPRDD